VAIAPSTIAPKAVVPGRRGRRTTAFGGFLHALPFLAPGFLLVAVFLLYPLVRAIYLSFMHWRGFGDPTFAGFGNFVQLFTIDPFFGTAFRNTLIWIVLSLVAPILLAVPVAVVLNGKLHGRVAFRTAFYLPAVLSSIVVAMSWSFIYRPRDGFFNQLLRGVGLGNVATDWLGDPHLALYSVLVVSIWAGTGAAMVLILAGLQGVPAELIEACRLDGGNRWTVFWHVEIPTLRPTLALVLLLSVINSLKAFDLIAAMTGGGPGGASQLLPYYAWTAAITNHNYGLGSAVAVILLILSLIVIVPYVRTTIRANRY
jgi:raffinose/stachyose/melibiose transport system permease protein